MQQIQHTTTCAAITSQTATTSAKYDTTQPAIQVTPPLPSVLTRDYQHPRNGIRAAVANVGNDFADIRRERELAAMVERRRQVSAQSWKADPKIMREMRVLLERRSTPPIGSDIPNDPNSSAHPVPATTHPSHDPTADPIAQLTQQPDAQPSSEEDYNISNSLFTFIRWVLRGAVGVASEFVDDGADGIARGRVEGGVESREGDVEGALPTSVEANMEGSGGGFVERRLGGIVVERDVEYGSSKDINLQQQQHQQHQQPPQNRHRHLPQRVSEKAFNHASERENIHDNPQDQLRLSANDEPTHMANENNMQTSNLLPPKKSIDINILDRAVNENGVRVPEPFRKSPNGPPTTHNVPTFASLSTAAQSSAYLEEPTVVTFIPTNSSLISLPPHPTTGLTHINNPNSRGESPSMGGDVSDLTPAVITIVTSLREGVGEGFVGDAGIGARGGAEDDAVVCAGTDDADIIVTEKIAKKHGIICRLRRALLGGKKKSGAAAAALDDSKKTLVESAGDLASVSSPPQSPLPTTAAHLPWGPTKNAKAKVDKNGESVFGRFVRRVGRVWV